MTNTHDVLFRTLADPTRLVRDRQDGRMTHYSAQLGALAPLLDWTRHLTGFWQSRFDDLEDLLKRMDQ